MAYFVGIDWADAQHDLCVLRDDGQIEAQFVISDDTRGFLQLDAYLRTLHRVQIIIERPNGLLVNFLLQRRWPVYFLPPNIVTHHRPRRSKSDRGDAYLLAYLLRQQNPDCRPVVRHSVQVEELRQVVDAHDKLQRELMRLTLQLRHHLKTYYPVVLKIFCRLKQPLTYAFLETFPDPQHTRQVPLEDLRTFFAQHHYRYMERVETHHRLLQEERVGLASTYGCQLHITALVATLRVVDEQVRRLKREIRRLFHVHPEADWWLHFPGLGYLNAARLLVRIGDNRAAFPNVEMLRATAGTVPITRRSGKSQAVLFRRECSRPLRKSFSDLAMKSKRYASWAQDYYDTQLARGHSRTRANRALANRWVGIVWKLWQTGERYNEGLHQANRQKQLIREMRATA